MAKNKYFHTILFLIYFQSVAQDVLCRIKYVNIIILMKHKTNDKLNMKQLFDIIETKRFTIGNESCNVARKIYTSLCTFKMENKNYFVYSKQCDWRTKQQSNLNQIRIQCT